MSRAIPIWTEVVCESCNDTIAGQFVWGGVRAMRPLYDELKAAKWVIIEGRPYCPPCAKKRLAQ